MTQRFSLYEDLSIAENLRFVADIYEMPNAADAVSSMLESLGLASVAGTSSPDSFPADGSSDWLSRHASIHKPELSSGRATAGVGSEARRDFGRRSTASPQKALPSSSRRTTWMKRSAATAWPTSLVEAAGQGNAWRRVGVRAPDHMGSFRPRAWPALAAAPSAAGRRASHRLRQQASRKRTRRRELERAIVPFRRNPIPGRRLNRVWRTPSSASCRPLATISNEKPHRRSKHENQSAFWGLETEQLVPGRYMSLSVPLGVFGGLS